MMAYSDWGAKIWCDGEPRHDLCDVTMLQVLEGENYQHYLEHHLKYVAGTDAEDDLHVMRHGVVGDLDGELLISLYKNGPYHGHYFIRGGLLVKLRTKMDKPNFSWDDVPRLIIRADGLTVKLVRREVPASVHCSFTDKLGRCWRGESGYLIGEGHQIWGIE